MSIKLEIWSQRNCAGCTAVKALATARRLEFVEYVIGVNATKEEFFEKFPHARTVPQVLINGSYIGGLEETRKYINDNITEA